MKKKIHRGRTKGATKVPKAEAITLVKQLYEEATGLEESRNDDVSGFIYGWKDARKKRRHFQAGHTADWWAYVFARKKQIAKKLGISLRTLSRYTADIDPRNFTADKPDIAKPTAEGKIQEPSSHRIAEATLLRALEGAPRRVLEKLGITERDDPISREKDAAVMEALLAIFRLAAEE